MLTYSSECAAALLIHRRQISNAALELKITLFQGGTFMTPASIRHTFFSILSDIENDISSFVQKPGSHMTRHRYCDFKDTVLATLSLSMNRSNTELLNYFGIKRHIPSKSAFTQQRQKLNDSFFPTLLKTFNNAIPLTKTYKGFHLVAVDGTDINLPTDKKDTVYSIKQARSDNYFYQMHVNALFDICENRYISVITQPKPQMNEKKAFIDLVENCGMPENTIFIGDRGYISLNTVANLIESNKYFLIRSKSPTSTGSFTKNLILPDVESDQYISFNITRAIRKCYTKHPDKYKCIKKSHIFDYIAPNDKSSIYTMSVRVTCVKLDDDSYEYLISNLPMDTFPSKELKDLYWKRWAIETSFKRLKYALSLVYLHSVNRRLIIQELYAKIIMYNFTSLLHSYVQRCTELLEKDKQNKYKYNVSFDDAVPIAKQLLKYSIKNSIIKALLIKHLSAVRVIDQPTSPRNVRSQTVKPLNNRA